MTLILSLVFSFGSVAFAANVTLTINPDNVTLADGGTIKVEYYITTDTSYSSCTITTSTNQTENIGPVVNGSQGSYDFNIPSSALGQTVTFNLYDGATLLASDTLVVNKKTLTPKIAATPSVPRTLYGEGEAVKFEFKIENQGDAPLDNIVVSAPELNGGKALNSGFSLAPGETKPVKFTYTMVKEVTINPVVSYSVGGAAQAPYKMSPVTLTLEKRKVEPVLTASNMKPAAGEEVTFTLTLTNKGNVPYTDIKVLANGEAMTYPSTLDASGTQTGTFKMTFQNTTDVFCSISLKDHAGETRQINSNTITIDLPVDATAVDSKLGFTMAVDRPQLTSSGTINFTGMITNGTDYELTNVKVTEAALGDVYTADTLAAGSTASIDYPVDINATTTYSFVLTATDKDGNTYTKNAEPVTVTIQGASPTATPGFDNAADVTETALTPDGNLGAGSIGALGIIAIVLVVLILGVGIALVVLWKKGQGPKSPSTPGRNPSAPVRKKPVQSSSARRRPAPPKNYRDRNNF